MRIVIIGGDAAGMSAASQVKRQKPEYQVVVFERGDYISYAACGIPYLIGGAVRRLEDLLELSPEEAREKRGIDLRLGHTVTSIDITAKKVRVESGGKSFDEPYDLLLIATGARGNTMGIDTGGFSRLHTMHNLYDADRITRFIADLAPKRMAVIGGGFIGLEAAESLVERGIETILVHRRPDLHRSFEKEVSDIILKKLEEKGVILKMGSAITGIEERGGVLNIAGVGGGIEADGAILAVGVIPNSELAAAAKIPLGVNGAIRVNEYLETGTDGVYAAGDCATSMLSIFAMEVHTPLALKANKQGLLAGMNMAGIREPFAGVMNAAVTRVFDLGVARTGLSFVEAEKLGLEPEKTVVTSRDRPHYFPGSKPVTSLVIVSRRDRRVLGAQMAGDPVAVKRIDVYTTAIFNRMTIDALFDLDLAYAPPFSPVYDPVLLAARVARKR